MMRMFLKKGVCVLLMCCVLLGLCSVGISAAVVSADSMLKEYVADFEGNYYSNLKSDNCTSAEIVDENGSKALEVSIKSNAQTNRFEIHNTKSGNLTLNDGKIYAVTIKYKVVQVGGDETLANAPTTINLVRYTGSGNQLVKVKAFPDSTYYHGDTTDWITASVVFKAGVASSPEYNRLAINVVSSSCPEIETNIEANITKVLFDDITVHECTENTKSVEFVSNGGNYCEPLLQGAGSSLELPTPTRDLYDFAGWYTDVDLKKAFKKTTMPGDLTTRLYAKWTVSEEAVTVKFESFNGTKVETAVGREGDALTLPVLTRDGANFAGWYDKEYKERFTASTFPAESTTLYAKWELIPQLCSFENVADFPKPDNGAFTQRCLLGDDKYKTKKDAYKSDMALHYSFQRGYDLTGSAGKGTPAGVMLHDENGNKVKLTAGKTYVITFKYKVVDYISSRGSIVLIAAGSGAWSDRAVQSSKTAAVYYDEADEKKGWQTATFTHTWAPKSEAGSYCYIAIGGEAEVYVDEVLVYEYDKNIKVQTNKMMLVFDSGIAPMVDTIYAERGTEVTLPELEMEGYRFLGWSYDEERLEPVQAETITLDKMYTKLYADWFKIPPVVDTPEPEPEPQPEPQPEPVVVEKEIPWLYIIIAAAALVVIAGVVVVIIVVAKKKKS